MDFALTREDEDFRAELRHFFTRNHPGKGPKQPDKRLRWQREWAAFLADEGYAAPAWPKRWGGMELSLTQQLVYHEETTLARLPSHPSPNNFIVGPTIILHGSDAQKQRYLKPMLRGDELWAQGFSEPDAGSDLPSLSTTATRVGNEYVLDGQKVWTSGGARADFLYTLVRTGPAGSGREGISYLLVNAQAPGVTIRPLREMTGAAHFCEMFFEQVRVPVENRVGPENGGWKIARVSLGHERSTTFISQAINYRRIVDELTKLARRVGVADDPRIRQQLAATETTVRLLRLNGARALSHVLQTGEPGPASSVNRLFHAQFEQRLHELAVDITGPYGLLAPTEPHSVERGRWAYGMLITRASTIGAGTAEIQRNTIAEQILGLPHEPSLDGATA